LDFFNAYCRTTQSTRAAHLKLFSSEICDKIQIRGREPIGADIFFGCFVRKFVRKGVDRKLRHALGGRR